MYNYNVVQLIFSKNEKEVLKMRKAGMMIAAASMALMMTFTAAATENMDDYGEVGFRLPAIEEADELEGLFLPYPIGAIDDDHHVYEMDFYYAAMPYDEAYRILYEGAESDEEDQAMQKALGVVGIVLAGDVDLDAIKAAYEQASGQESSAFEQAKELGSAEGFTFYFLPTENREEYLSGIEENYADVYQKLETALTEALNDAEFFEPEDETKQMAGGKIEFTTTDLDGNIVTSEELFSQNEITMINCWGTWCHNCVDEMAELAKIHSNMQEKGCGIVGLEYERYQDDETYQEAREMMEEWGTNYPNVIMPDELSDQLEGYPTSIFVDREGNVLGIPIVGAAVSKYEPRLDALLSREEAAPETEAEVQAVAIYHINVTGEDGPVEGVTVQFCSDDTCRFEETDEDGVATIEVPAGSEYHAQVVEVPDGYEEDDTIYYTTAGSDEVNIELRKSE